MATQNGKLGKAVKRVAGKVKKAAHQAKRAVKKRAKKNCPPATAAKAAKGKAAFNPASLFAGITPAKVKRIRRVRERQTGQQGDLIGAKQGWAKVKWDNRTRPSLIKRSEIALVNPTGRQKPGVALGDRAKNGRWVGRKTGLRKALTLTQRIAKSLPLDANAVYTKASNTLRQRMKAKGYQLDHAIDAWVVKTNPAGRPKPGVALGDRAKNVPARNSKKGGAGSRKAKTVVRAKVIKKLVINKAKKNPRRSWSAYDRAFATTAAAMSVAQLESKIASLGASITRDAKDKTMRAQWIGFRTIARAELRKRKARAKKNPPKSGGAVRKEFLGRDSTKLSKVNVSRHMPIKPTPDILAQLNKVKIKGRGVIKMPRGAKLIADHRKRIWFSERIAKPNPAQDKNTVEPVGEIVHVVYTARKEPRTDALGQTHFGEAKAIPYIHRLGEDSGKRPTLYVDDEGYGVIKGGNYSIDWRGIID